MLNSWSLFYKKLLTRSEKISNSSSLDITKWNYRTHILKISCLPFILLATFFCFVLFYFFYAMWYYQTSQLIKINKNLFLFKKCSPWLGQISITVVPYVAYYFRLLLSGATPYECLLVKSQWHNRNHLNSFHLKITFIFRITID